MKRWGWLLRLTKYALPAILVAGGAYLRFGHSDWDGGNQLHPDERGILFVAQSIELPDSLGDVLAPHRSPLNPFRTPEGIEQDYPYGHLPLYTMVIGQRLLGRVCPVVETVCKGIAAESFGGRLLNVSGLPRFDHLTAVGRALSALADTLTIVTVWLLARELFGARAGLPADGFCAIAVLHLQNAHFGTVDTGLALLATLSVWLLARYTRTQRRHDAILAGVCAGLALGCKASAVALVFPIGAAFLTRSEQAADGQRLGHRLRDCLKSQTLKVFDPGKYVTALKKMASPEPEDILRKPLGSLPRLLRQLLRISSKREMWLTVGAALLTFILTNPYALLDPAPFLGSLATQAAMASGALDWPFTRQYAGTLPLVYPIEQQARWGLGLPLTLAVYGGLAWAAWRAFTGRSRAWAVAVAWAAAMLVAGGAQQIKYPRYLLPLTPTLFAFAGGLLTIPLAGDGKAHRAMAWLRGACIVLVVVPTTLYALALEGMYRQSHPWVAASEWVYRELPAGVHIAVEQGDDALPLDITLDGRLYLAGAHVEACAIDPFAEPDDEAKLSRTLQCLAGADYLILASNRHYGVIPRLAGRYPLTAAYYQELFDGELGFELERSFRRPPTLLGWRLIDDPFAWPELTNPLGGWGDRAISLGPADESFTVYDRPLVLVFRNERRLSVGEMRDRIGVAEGWNGG